MSCCPPGDPPAAPAVSSTSSCSGGSAAGRDRLLIGSATIIIIGYGLHLAFAAADLHPALIGGFSHGIFDVINTIWWGIVLGVVMVGALSKVPREFVIATLGPPGAGGIMRAAVAGVLLDLCSHGILMVAAKLYERGASTGQVIAFLIASPWNSLSLTLILVALLGLPWTLLFIALSMVIAVITGFAFEALVGAGRLPSNPNQRDLPQDFRFWPEARTALAGASCTPTALAGMLRAGVSDSRMVMRWILFGVVLAALVRAVFDPSTFAAWFGPTLGGLALTVLGATIIEVCSEGSAPIAGDLFARAGAPGNAFAFLMAGVSTDYTEILVLREMAGSWKFALFLPLLSLPQIVVLGWLLNEVPV